MRERTLKVKTDKLRALSKIYRPTKVAEKLNISKQRWRNYEIGKNDIPESVLKSLCQEFDLAENEIVMEA